MHHFSPCETSLPITAEATVILTAAPVAIFILLFHFKLPDVKKGKEKSQPYPHPLWRKDDLRLTWRLGSVDGPKKGGRWDWIWNKPRSLWGSQPGSHSLYPSHLVRLKYLTRDKKLGSSQTVRWPHKRHHENSAASAVDGLKMVEAGKQHSQDGVFFPSTTRGTRSHKHVQNVNQHRI